jgi:hypothetical protein
MEGKRRSGSFGSQETAEISNEAANKLSLSEGSIVDKETSPQSNASPESSPGPLKKPRKFKPRKYIAKKLKLRKSDKTSDQEQNAAESQSEQESIKTSSSVSSKLSEKLSSPKLQRFNFVKRFSSGKKSYRVSPSDDAGEESKSSLRSLSVSESSVHEEKEANEPQSFISQVDIPLIPTQKETVTTLESKKVELKITMAKFEKRTSPSVFEREPSKDIELPLQARASGDQFYAKANVEQQIKPINDEDTFAKVLKEGFSVKSATTEKPSEVEKYSLLTSSLQTILNTAKDLEDFGARGGSETKELKFPELPELKIREEKDKIDEKQESESKNSQQRGSENSFQTTKNQPEISQETQHKFSKIEQKEIRKITTAFNTSTPIRSEFEQELTELEESNILESDDMKNQKKSKIPIDQKRLSASFDASTATSTVHTQEARQPYHVNLSPSSSESHAERISDLKFEVGTPVRNFPSPNGSTNILAPLAISESANTQDSSLEEFHSPKSEKSLQPESITRRKIAYVPQLTVYTAEEQELIYGNFEANADSFDVSSMQDSSVFPVFDDSVVRTYSELIPFCP